MTTARLFKNGRSQAVRIPKEMEFQAEEVEVVPMGEGLYIYPVAQDAWSHTKSVAESAGNFPEHLPPAPDQKRDLRW